MKCLRCGYTKEKQLRPLFEYVGKTLQATNFYVCSERIGCRTRQLAARPARMSTQANLWSTRTSSSGSFPSEKKRNPLDGAPRED